MGKKYCSEKKLTKQKLKIKSRKSNRSVKKKRIYEIKSKVNKNNIQPSITSLIDSLDDGEKPIINENFNVKFGSNISDSEFIIKFKIGIIWAKNKFKLKNLKILKKLLFILKNIDSSQVKEEDSFEFLSSNNRLEKIYKMDLILYLLSSENYIESFNFSNINNVEKEFTTKEEYFLYSDKNTFEAAIPYNKNISKQYSFERLEKLLFSKTIINTYIEVLKDLYDKSLSNKKVISAIKNFKNNHNIFFVEMGLKFFGFSLFDGTILLNKKYYDQNRNDYIVIFIIFSTIFHEYMHALSRIFRDDENFFYDTDEFLKHRRINPKESGDYFDNKILFDILPDKKITTIEAEYLLDEKNYVYDSSQTFKDSFMKFRKSKIKKIKMLPSQSISKENNDYNSLNIICGRRSGRINMNKKNN